MRTTTLRSLRKVSNFISFGASMVPLVPAPMMMTGGSGDEAARIRIRANTTPG